MSEERTLKHNWMSYLIETASSHIDKCVIVNDCHCDLERHDLVDLENGAHHLKYQAERLMARITNAIEDIDRLAEESNGNQPK